LSTLKLIIRTPEAQIIDTHAESLYLSTDLGDMMILPHHASISTSMLYSPVLICNGHLTEQYIVKNGLLFFSNTKNEAVILCYSAIKKDEVDITSVKKYLELIEQKLAEKKGSDLSEYQYKFLENEKMVLVKQIEAEGKK